jgi:hypothetical protein
MNKVFIDNRVLTMHEFVNTPNKKFKYLFQMSRTPKGNKNLTGNRVVFLHGKKSFNGIYRSNKSLSPIGMKKIPQRAPLSKNVSRRKKLKPITGEDFKKIINEHRASIQPTAQSKILETPLKSRIFNSPH